MACLVTWSLCMVKELDKILELWVKKYVVIVNLQSACGKNELLIQTPKSAPYFNDYYLYLSGGHFLCLYHTTLPSL